MSRTASLCVGGLICGVAFWWCLPAPVRVSAEEGQPVPPAAADPNNVAPLPHRAKGTFDYKATSKAEQKILAALTDPQGVDIEFIDTPLKDAIDFLADAHNITMLVDEQALSEEGIGTDVQLNRTLSGVSLKSAMHIMLEPLGLTYVTEDDVLKVTTQEAAAKKREVRVYNVEHFGEMGVEAKALSETLKKILAPPVGQPTKVERDAETQWVILRNDEGIVAVRNAEGQAIYDFDSSNATIDVLGRLLVVSAPQAAHEKIRDALTQLDRHW